MTEAAGMFTRAQTFLYTLVFLERFLLMFERVGCELDVQPDLRLGGCCPNSWLGVNTGILAIEMVERKRRKKILVKKPQGNPSFI